MPDIAALSAAQAGVKATTSGLVELHNTTESLGLVVDDIKGILAASRIPFCADIAALQALVSTESIIAYLDQVGFFVYNGNAGGTVNYQSIDGGYWNRFANVVMSDLVNEAGIAAGKYIVWDGTQYALDIPTVVGLGWTNITGRPIITGTTNPAIAGNLSVGGNVGVTGNETVGGTLGVTGAVTLAAALSALSAAITNNLTVGGTAAITGTLAVTGAVTFAAALSALSAAITNNLTVGGTLGVTGAATIGGTLGVTGASTLTGNISTPGNLTMSGASSAITMPGNSASIIMAGPASGLSCASIIASIMTATNIGDGTTVQVFGQKVQATQRLIIPVWANVGGRPSAPAAGTCGLNFGTSALEIYSGSGWISIT